MHPDPTFESQRPRLFGLAYRLLGSRSDAEEVVQDAWLRWQAGDRAAIRDPQAWLATVATRLGLDRLRAARSARVHYTGPWLPEPLEIAEEADPAERHARAEQVSVAFLALLERLGPDERAAFLLKEAFDYDYAQIASLLGHAQANCRQLVHRARKRLKAERPRFAVAPERHRQLLERFMHAAHSGERAAIVALLDANARLLSDGGGKVAASLRPLLGAERIARLYWAVARRSLGLQVRIGSVNGEPAILRFQGGRLHSATLVVIARDRIIEVLTLMNPDKLPALAGPRSPAPVGA
ncbi:RNA polymerase sigma-70 factor [Xanthomonas theicola]|uniref:RNA polymerase subunit sigma-24 n=1 Tax=Xanthomonas theicola TaxID=56464 RepID=A0A2S6ZGH5_9XANT|nr:RNA polymerase sigma-70 factor [Xanthomonas theicola]PPT91353.1 RNA polymerase subunit sigma-24 [Xanthomonas theicola]QNH24390.1 RNA polymerase sigma-70 factor [Xanthomonas theicola]